MWNMNTADFEKYEIMINGGLIGFNSIYTELQKVGDGCVSDNSTTDSYGDGCSDYVGNSGWCGDYDDEDFTSNT